MKSLFLSKSRLFALGAALFLAGCSATPDLPGWRARESSGRPQGERGQLAAEIDEVKALRGRLDLSASRRLALALAAENPEHPEALLLASRAESDAVFLLRGAEKEKRDLAALSALEYSRRAVVAAPGDVPTLAQHSWALGTTTHLQPMFSRSKHAQETLRSADAVLEKAPRDTTALATKSILRLRLATLPWIARLMASGAPRGDLDEAARLAEQCVEEAPSIEHRLLLAKARLALGEAEEARSLLRIAVESADRFPRDRELRPAAEELLDGLAD
jgi:tetratricopeptide (TPR) repeat protein